MVPYLFSMSSYNMWMGALVHQYTGNRHIQINTWIFRHIIPLQHKISVVRTLFTRASTLSSSMPQRVAEELVVNEALSINGYPQQIIRSHRRRPHHIAVQPSSPTVEKVSVATISLPYIQGISEGIRRILSHLDIKVSLHPHLTLCCMLTKPKDPVPFDYRKGIIYKISCKDCPQSYVGQSGRSLLHRIKEHKRAVSQGDCNASALAEHSLNT